MTSLTRIRLTAATASAGRIIAGSGNAAAKRNINGGGRKINNGNNRFLTTTTASAPTTTTKKNHNPLFVISRRNWKEYESKYITPTKPINPNKASNNAGGEKPWPRNIQIAGYVVAAIFIPYSTVWLITSNPTLRQTFGQFLPMDKLRKHFGDKEWDIQSYPEMMESQAQEEEEDLPNGYYQFPLEASYRDRQQQTIIEEFDTNEVVANLYYVGNNNNVNQQTTITKEVPASTKANPTSLCELMGIGTTNSSKNNNKINIEGTISIDFVNNEDDENQHDESTSTSNVTTTDTDTTTTVSFGDDVMVTIYDDSATSSKEGNNGLLSTMYSYSSWHHVPNMQQGQEGDVDNPKSTTTTNMDLEISKLEYIVNDLESNLKDPLCTRDIDDMTTELNQSKKDLRRLKWKRRLGW